MEDLSKHKFSCYHVAGAETVLLFIHGIVEGPAQFRPLTRAAARRGISAVSLLLPGHGSDGRAFAQSRMRQWQEYVDAAAAHLCRRYPHVVLVGHSMGGLLAMEACRNAPAGIDGIFALGLPLWLRVRAKGILEGYKASSGHINPEEESARAALDAYSIRGVRPLCYLRWLPRYEELFRLCRDVRRRLWALRIPVQVLQSADDEFVSRRTADRLKQLRPDWEVGMLVHSGHFYYNPEDLKQAEEALFDFVSRVTRISDAKPSGSRTRDGDQCPKV